MLKIVRKSEGTSEDRDRTMPILKHIAHIAFALREFIAPTYRPERHYMRGPGPACARLRSPFGTPAASH